MRLMTVTDSDIIEKIGFEWKDSVGAMEVVFKSMPDAVYRYENVGPDVFAHLVSAESIGKLFHELFRKTRYPFTKSIRDARSLKK